VRGHHRRYRRAIADVLEARGEFCEVCGVPAHHVHHVHTVSETGIAHALAYEPANMLILCNDCHVLMHPGSRNRNMWWRMHEAAISRGHALSRAGR